MDRVAESAVVLRPRRESDADFLRCLYASTRTAEMDLLPWPDEEKQAFLDQQFEAQTRHYDEHFSDAEFSIVEKDGEPIGRLYLDRRADEIRIVDIAIVSEHRGHGIGGKLLFDVLDEADRVGKAVRIHVEHNNPALRLYKRLGFRHVDSTGVYFLMEWKGPGSD